MTADGQVRNVLESICRLITHTLKILNDIVSNKRVENPMEIIISDERRPVRTIRTMHETIKARRPRKFGGRFR